MVCFLLLLSVLISICFSHNCNDDVNTPKSLRGGYLGGSYYDLYYCSGSQFSHGYYDSTTCQYNTESASIVYCDGEEGCRSGYVYGSSAVYCDGDYGCENAHVTTSEITKGLIYCDDEYGCKGATLSAPTIYCDGGYGCTSATIISAGSGSLLYCDADYSCQYTIIDCSQTGVCPIIYCGSYNACYGMVCVYSSYTTYCSITYETTTRTTNNIKKIKPKQFTDNNKIIISSDDSYYDNYIFDVCCSIDLSCIFCSYSNINSLFCGNDYSCAYATITTTYSVVCEGDGSCFNSVIATTDYYQGRVHCDDDITCAHATITSDQVGCEGDLSCGWAIMLYSTNINCNGDFSCIGIQVYCSSSKPCYIYCTNWQACIWMSCPSGNCYPTYGSSLSHILSKLSPYISINKLSLIENNLILIISFISLLTLFTIISIVYCIRTKIQKKTINTQISEMTSLISV
jgi:hypothetical protein